MSSHAGRGQDALAKGDYHAAIQYLTLALSNDGQSPLWYIQRSTAYQRTGEHELALADADNALLVAISRSRREQMATAHFRRAVALHSLKRFGDARLCLNWTRKYNEKEKALTIWIAKVKNDYEKAGGEEAEMNETTVKEVPDKPEEVGGKKVETAPKVNKKENIAPKKVEAAVTPKTVTATPKEKVRQEWYQSPNSVTIEVFAKGVPKDKVEVVIEEGCLEVSFPVLASNSTYDYTANPLFSFVDPSKSSFRVTPHKIEIILHKAVSGKWSSLEGTDTISPTSTDEPEKVPAPVLNPAGQKGPVYPTSSKSGPKNWDTVVKDDEVEEDGGVDDFFKKLYKGADDDTRRAMMKSYQESNGTALSTSWGDVGEKKYETTPPEGMEAKKWEI
ncbi:hypothetical protein BJ875DRAFT_499625 [Amylocarpus encephaloides]|uniref:Uncharacterized protein n=1 Tax=Amylocarpus encephaloides TaxID=45428 RepID=A0A9P8C1F3_9HELO|nr:hypothetical protein BJ875DRAFT_499625 [Amylocarpus encephaloides]